VLAVRAPQLAVRGHHLDRLHVVGRQAVFTAEEAQAATQRVTDHTDIRGGTREPAQPVPGRGLHDVTPHGARLDTGGPRHRVDLDAAHPFGLEQDGVRQRSQRQRAVASAPRRDPQAVFGGERHGGHHVLPGFSEDHRGRLLVSGEVERLPRLLEATLARQYHLALEHIGQLARLP
jgi:hypothetical protein